VTPQLPKGAALESEARDAVAEEFDGERLLLRPQLDYIQARDEVTVAGTHA